jgi:hypothetical protein
MKNQKKNLIYLFSLEDGHMFTFDLPGGTGSTGPSDKHWGKI